MCGPWLDSDLNKLMKFLHHQENLNTDWILDDIKELLLILLGVNGTVIMWLVFFLSSCLLEISSEAFREFLLWDLL